MSTFSVPARRSVLRGGAAAVVASAIPAVARATSGGPWTIELFTSQGCSSCPPADLQLGKLCRRNDIVALSFHVDYWDYIGWKDRFAQPAFTARQKDFAAQNHANSIYTPQLLRNGRDWSDWQGARGYPNVAGPQVAARARISLQRVMDTDGFEARIEPGDTQAPWSAYWTVTEDGHSSRVKAGENAGEYLKHDFVVRQYAAAGTYQGPQQLKFFALAAQPEHPRRINLVVQDARSLQPLQALSLACP